MSTNQDEGSQKQVTRKSEGRYRFKSAGRVAAGKRLHERGIAGMGGRRPTHGRRALVELLKRGLEEGTPIAAFQRELTDCYISDLGGEANVSVYCVRRVATPFTHTHNSNI